MGDLRESIDAMRARVVNCRVFDTSASPHQLRLVRVSECYASAGAMEKMESAVEHRVRVGGSSEQTATEGASVRARRWCSTAVEEVVA